MTDPVADDAVTDDETADRATGSASVADTEQEDRHPRGTLLITSLFLVALIVMWVSMYFMMLSRS